MNKIIKIANGQGFWGDSSQAPIDLIQSCDIDYLTMDYLAEVTLSIMQKQKAYGQLSRRYQNIIYGFRESGECCRL